MNQAAPAQLPARPTLAQLVRPGLNALRSNWRPFLLLQAAALGVVLAYFHVDAVHDALGRLAAVRERMGPPFTMIAAAVAGAILPEIAKAATQRGWRLDRARLGDIGFFLVFFALNGLLVDRFYALMATVFGDGNAPLTILKKTLVDQLGFTPFIALPLVGLGLSWRRHRYSFGRTLNEIVASPTRWYLARVLTLMLPGWCFWMPMVLLIYSLPGPLQVAMWSGAMGAWSLVMVFIGSADSDPAVPPPE